MVKMKGVWIFLAFVLVVVAGYFGFSSLSTIETNSQTIDIPYSCEVASDCNTALLQDNAATQESLNEFLTMYDIQCKSNSCVGVPK